MKPSKTPSAIGISDEAKQCTILKFDNLPVEQVDTLSDALPHYSTFTDDSRKFLNMPRILRPILLRFQYKRCGFVVFFCVLAFNKI